MKKGFRLKLFFIMIIFATTIAFTIAIADQYRLTAQLEENNLFQVEQIEDVLTYSLQTIDKVYYFFDIDTADRMEANTKYLSDLYDKNPDFGEWEFDELKGTLGMDIYMINEDNVITHSSLERDIGINFEECCHSLAKILTERRLSGTFYHDGIDIDQGSGEITKYSYMATKDKNYIIELGYNLQDGQIFNEFNFIRTSRELVERYPMVDEITILNMGGIPFGKPREPNGFTGVRRDAFEQALTSGEVVEMRADWNGDPSVYRYVPITSNYDVGQTKFKVIEIVYNDIVLQEVIQQNQKSFLMKLSIILLVTIILSLIISKLVSRPMHMAFHDSLTGIKNRAAFEETVSKELQKQKLQKQQSSLALLMFDLDNFKLVNDCFGHDFGDELLKLVGNTLREIISKNAEVFRLGGDEFVILMLNASSVEAEALAENILSCLDEIFIDNETYRDVNISASLGIAMAREHGEDLDTLYKKADIAMYRSKEKGKNQYFLYQDDVS